MFPFNLSSPSSPLVPTGSEAWLLGKPAPAEGLPRAPPAFLRDPQASGSQFQTDHPLPFTWFLLDPSQSRMSSCLVQKTGGLTGLTVARKVKSLTIHCFTWENTSSSFITVTAASNVDRSRWHPSCKSSWTLSGEVGVRGFQSQT